MKQNPITRRAFALSSIALTHDMAQGGSGNGHYGGNAEVYMDVGEAMGKAMAEWKRIFFR